MHRTDHELDEEIMVMDAVIDGAKAAHELGRRSTVRELAADAILCWSMVLMILWLQSSSWPFWVVQSFALILSAANAHSLWLTHRKWREFRAILRAYTQ